MTLQECIQKFEETLPNYVGHFNLISQKDGDQGDTAQRVGTLFNLLTLLKEDRAYDALYESGHANSENSIQSLEVFFGHYRRSSNANYWGSRWDNFSRDQLSILKLGMMGLGLTSKLSAILICQVFRLGFHQNIHKGTDCKGIKCYKLPDPPGFFYEFTDYLRYFLGQYSIPFTSILDITYYISLKLRKDNNWDGDNMFAQRLLFAYFNHPSAIIKHTMKLYLKTNFIERLENYHVTSSNGCEPLYWLYRAVFTKYF